MSRTELRSLGHTIGLICKECGTVYNIATEDYVDWITTGIFEGKFPCTTCGCNLFGLPRETTIYLNDRFPKFKELHTNIAEYLTRISRSHSDDDRAEGARLMFEMIVGTNKQWVKMFGTKFLDIFYNKMSNWCSVCDWCAEHTRSLGMERELAMKFAPLIFGEGEVEWEYCKTCDDVGWYDEDYGTDDKAEEVAAEEEAMATIKSEIEKNKKNKASAECDDECVLRRSKRVCMQVRTEY